MDHVQSVEALPGPIIDARFVTQLGHASYRAIPGPNKQLVVSLVSDWKPLGGALGENSLQERSFSPRIQAGFLAQIWFENYGDRGAARFFQEGNLRGVGVGDSVPILEAFDQFLAAIVLRLGSLRSGG